MWVLVVCPILYQKKEAVMDRSVFESCEEDADELFNHLEELLRGKDAMEKKGRRLAQARAAREVLVGGRAAEGA